MSKIYVDAPEALNQFEIAQAIVGDGWLLKAERLKGHEKTFQDYKAMATLSRRFIDTYKQQLEKMVAMIRAYVEKRIILGPLGKAGPKRPVATPQQVRELRQLIEDYHSAFIAGTVGPDTLAPGEVQRLIDAGILPSDIAYTFQPGAKELPPKAMNAIEEAYRYGHVLASSRNLDEKRLRHGMTYEEFSKEWAPRVPLSEEEKHALEWLKTSAATHIRGLGNQIADDFSTLAIEADAELRRKYMGVVREELESNVQRRDAWRKLASDLGHRTGDWARDFARIAATEKQKAMQEGITVGLIKRHGDPDEIYVAKQPNPGACPDCLRLHTEAGGKLRIFKLSELIANGTNVGKKRRAWSATVGPVHPYCGCELIHVPPGMGFDEAGNLVPLDLTRADWLERDLMKALPKEPAKAKHLTYGDSVPEQGVIIRIGDPMVRAEVEKVVAATPPEIFDKKIGVTLITTDTPRVQNPLEEHDFAYWTGNEIRLMQTLPASKIWRVLRHELGHSLNIFLMRKLGGVQKVREWHNELYLISQKEGWVSEYAPKMPIENAAEVTMLYLYARPRLMRHWPKQFVFCHKAYREIWDNADKRKRGAA